MDDPGVSGAAEITIAFTPKQLFTGFAIVAGLVVYLLGRRSRRGRSATDRSDDGSADAGRG